MVKLVVIMATKIVDVIMRDKPVRFLVMLLNGQNEKLKNVSYLARATDTTYSHTYNVLNCFIKNGLVSHEKKGRTVYLNLTKTGQEIALRLNNIIEKLSIIDKNNGDKIKI